MTADLNDMMKDDYVLDDNDLLCANQPDFSMRFSSRRLEVVFRSDQTQRFKGFQITAMCVNVGQMFLLVNPSGALFGFPGIMGPTGRCTELGGFSPPPVPMVS